VIDPLLFASAWKLAVGSAVGTVLGMALWMIAGRMKSDGEAVETDAP
jgi:hypothetical protein